VVVKAAVRAVLIVLAQPHVKQALGFTPVLEEVHIETHAHQFLVEALDVGMLPGAALHDVEVFRAALGAICASYRGIRA
jgi:hypothetical protein